MSKMSEPEPQELGAEVISGSLVSTEDTQELTKAKYNNLCRELNIDRQTEKDGYQMFHEVSQRCSLEVRFNPLSLEDAFFIVFAISRVSFPTGWAVHCSPPAANPAPPL